MITKPLMNKLDTLQLKGLRNVLGMKTTFIDRNNSNKKVFENANAQNNLRRTPWKDITILSTYVKCKQHELLAHTYELPTVTQSEKRH